MRILFNMKFGVPEGPAARQVGELMRRYWVQFAATGAPNGKGLPDWPGYGGAKPQYPLLSDPIRAVPGDGMENCNILDVAWETTSKGKASQSTSFIEVLASHRSTK